MIASASTIKWTTSFAARHPDFDFDFDKKKKKKKSREWPGSLRWRRSALPLGLADARRTAMCSAFYQDKAMLVPRD